MDLPSLNATHVLHLNNNRTRIAAAIGPKNITVHIVLARTGKKGPSPGGKNLHIGLGSVLLALGTPVELCFIGGTAFTSTQR